MLLAHSKDSDMAGRWSLRFVVVSMIIFRLPAVMVHNSPLLRNKDTMKGRASLRVTHRFFHKVFSPCTKQLTTGRTPSGTHFSLHLALVADDEEQRL